MQVLSTQFKENLNTYNLTKHSVNEIHNISTKPLKDTFSPSFTGFFNVLEKATNTKIINTANAADIFGWLFKNITQKKYTITDDYNSLLDIYNKNGFWELFKFLHNNDPQNNISKKLATHNLISLIKLRKTNVIMVHNTDYRNFLEKFFGIEIKNKSPNITFSDRYNSISFSINNKGNLQVSQYNTDSCYTTEFYKTTGSIKKITKRTDTTKEIFYYHENGKPDKLKTLLLRILTNIY